MVKIHWSFYLILGAAVLFVSYKIDPQKFKLFIWLGYFFLVVGVAKLGIWFINKKNESPAERREIKRDVYQLKQRAIKYCHGCGNALMGYEKFCPMCAQRLD